MRKFFSTTTARLAVSYLVIIMIMTIGFSMVIYRDSAHELGRQLPPPGAFGVRRIDDISRPGTPIHLFFQQRIDEGRHLLLLHLIILNAVTLVAGGVLSYYLARLTLRPVEDNMEAQAQFVSDASHELRTPLTVLQTTNEVALRRQKLSSAQAKDILRHNVEELTRLDNLTAELLKLARTDDQPDAFERVAVQDIVTDALNAVVASASRKKINVDDQVPKLSINGNKSNLTSALVALLDNAVKYSPDKSTIHVEAAEQGKYVLISVRDEGLGIDAEHLPHIFDRFYRADQSRNKQQHEGYGIGLSLAKKIAEQHHGEILAVSTPGKGSVFTLKIPLS